MVLHTTTYKILLHGKKVLGYMKLPHIFTGNMVLIALPFEIPELTMVYRPYANMAAA